MTTGKILGYILGIALFLALCLFLPAGRIDWERGWLFAAVMLLTFGIAAVYLWRVNPEIYIARGRYHKGTKRWDAILLCFLFPAMFAVFVVGALDDGRFGWSHVPWWAVGLGYLLLLAGIWLSIWAEAVNKFFEPTVRLQTDRGQTVIDTGPYAFVRHPGYAGGIVMFAGIALALGSLWALVPAAISTAILLLRTKWEDQTLQAELPGYQQYTTRVRNRLIPGVW